MTRQRCPKCGDDVLVNELSSWRCERCGRGSEVFQCPVCKIWVVKEYDERPIAVECTACTTFVAI